jgi:hypothetical protein
MLGHKAAILSPAIDLILSTHAPFQQSALALLLPSSTCQSAFIPTHLQFATFALTLPLPSCPLQNDRTHSHTHPTIIESLLPYIL